jgi:hypothetical protein
MTGPPGDVTETPYRGGWLAAVGREARRNAPQREELGRSKAAQSGFCGHPAGLITIALDFRVIGVLAIAQVHSSLWKVLPALPLLRQRAGSHCVNRADCAIRHFVHDPLDNVRAAAALGAAAEVVIDLTHSQPLRGVRKRGPKLMVTEHIARAHDHELS